MPKDSFATGRDSGASRWALTLNDYGYVGATPPLGQLVYPPSPNLRAETPPQTAQLIAVGPDSTADRAIISSVAGVPAVLPMVTDPVNSDSFGLPRSGVNQIVVSPQGPFVLAPGRPDLFVIADQSAYYGDLYLPFGTNATAAFGNLGAPTFEPPFIQLVYYFQTVVVPAARNPMWRSATRAVPVGAQASFASFRFWPVMGRKRITVTARVDGGAAANVRVGLITPRGNAAGDMIESQLATGLVDGATGTQLVADTQQLASFVSVYTQSTGTGVAGNVHITMQATD